MPSQGIVCLCAIAYSWDSYAIKITHTHTYTYEALDGRREPLATLQRGETGSIGGSIGSIGAIDLTHDMGDFMRPWLYACLTCIQPYAWPYTDHCHH